ncbi:hypothetical protein [Alienimonas sp. DA493]|uniref:hypothetical protein n=1 Tax=Alienimonas sp. DA493 TaxID=3373605 RepID=UPI0037550FD7
MRYVASPADLVELFTSAADAFDCPGYRMAARIAGYSRSLQEANERIGDMWNKGAAEQRERTFGKPAGTVGVESLSDAALNGLWASADTAKKAARGERVPVVATVKPSPVAA